MLTIKNRVDLMILLVIAIIIKYIGYYYSNLALLAFLGYYIFASSLSIQLIIDPMHVAIKRLLVQSIQIGLGTMVVVLSIQMMRQPIVWQTVAMALIIPLLALMVTVCITLLSYIENIPYKKLIIGLLYFIGYISLMSVPTDVNSFSPWIVAFIGLVFVLLYLAFRVWKIKHLL